MKIIGVSTSVSEEILSRTVSNCEQRSLTVSKHKNANLQPGQRTPRPRRAATIASAC